MSTTLVSTAFTGTDGAAWPAPWVKGNGTVTIKTNRGQQVTPAVQWNDATATAGQTLGDGRVTATVRFSAATGAGQRIQARFNSATGNGYGLYVTPEWGTVQLMKVTAWSDTVLLEVPGTTWTANTDYRVAFDLVGSALKAKWWPVASAEPATWNINVTDATYASGDVRLVTVATAAAAATGLWDDVLIESGVVTSAATPVARVAFGAFTANTPDSTTEMDAFNHAAGAMPDLLTSYEAFTKPFSTETTTRLNTVRARGAVSMITWEPWDWSGLATSTTYTLANITRGDFDTYITSWANGLKAWGDTVYLRFAHEMNGTWYPWCEGINGNAAGSYIAAWRHVRDRFTAAGVTNVKWVWCPNITAGGPPMAQVYPGDSYVDVIALDGYNWGTAGPNGWQTAAQVFNSSLTEVKAINSTKPLWIAETASAEVGGNKAAWITDFFTWIRARGDIALFMWFSVNKETDWRIDSTPAAAAAFRKALTGLAATDAARIGFHNDAFLAPYEDYGTYTTFTSMDAAGTRAYVAAQAGTVPNGGESAVGNPPHSDFPGASADLTAYRWTFLNPEYHADVLNSWTQANKDEIAQRLGYRLRLTTATLPATGAVGAGLPVTFAVANDGYSQPWRARPVQIVFKSAANTYTRTLAADLRTWAPGATTTVTETVTAPAVAGTYAMYLNLPDANASRSADPAYSIQLANTGVWQAATGWNDLGASVTIT